MTIKHIFEDDPYKATLYDEAIWVYYEEHRNDPENVAQLRERLKCTRGEPYDKELFHRKVTPDSFLDHVETCDRCVKLLRKHINECAPANTLLEYVDRKK